MTFRKLLHHRAAACGARVVLAEGWDPRIVAAAGQLERAEIAAVRTLPHRVTDDQHLDHVADHLAARRPDKVRDRAHGRALAEDPVRFAAGLVALGYADAAVAGATCPTADVLRAALWAIGPAVGIETVSSAFYMVFERVPEAMQAASRDGTVPGAVLTFTDCAVVPEPDPAQLAQIGYAAARDRGVIVGDDPVVAFLSFSTKGSAEGRAVERVQQAVAQFRALAPDIPCDGELQGDAALVPAVAKRKAPGSTAAGRANVLVFPDLDSGNIAYKLVQRLAGASAIGPIIQGLAQPMADLSRGATTSDVVDVAAVAILQAAGHTAGIARRADELHNSER